MDATKGIHPGFTGNAQSTVSQSCLSWEAGTIVCSWPLKKFTGEGKEESLQNFLVVEGFPLQSLDKEIRYPTWQQHFLPLTSSQLISIIWSLPNYNSLKLPWGCWGGALWEGCSASMLLPFLRQSSSIHLTSLLRWSWESTIGTRTKQYLTHGCSSEFHLQAPLYIELSWCGHLCAHVGILLDFFLSLFFFLRSSTYLQRILHLGKDVYLF